MYIHLFNEVLYNQDTSNWVAKVRDMLQRSGFVDVWTYPDSVDHLKFIPVFRQRVRDQYIAQWNEKKAVSTSLQFYKEFVSYLYSYIFK